MSFYSMATNPFLHFFVHFICPSHIFLNMQEHIYFSSNYMYICLIFNCALSIFLIELSFRGSNPTITPQQQVQQTRNKPSHTVDAVLPP
mmetsp:Transcript_51421/g.101533  ORF Transcript_51421/g.101533 Transcript_51421/m.101533 type:complete len:89 (-) Transcript_51421:1617-1883(-)